MIVADSDVLIDALQGRQDMKERVARELRSRSLGTTTVDAFELLSGARSPSSARHVKALIAALRILPVDLAAGEAAAEARRHLESSGTSMGMADYLIAGVCLERGLPLLTGNRTHFERVPDLVLASSTA